VKYLAAIIGVVALLGLSVQPAAAQTIVRPYYLALGDSLALGVEAPANNDGQPGYPDLILQRLLGYDPDMRYENFAVSGETSQSFISGGQLNRAKSLLQSAPYGYKCIEAVTLSIGGNDFGKILTGEATASAAIPAFESNLRYILGQLLSVPDDPTCRTSIALMDYYNPYPGLPIPPTNEALADLYQPQLNAIIHEVASEFGVPVARVAPRFVGREAELLYVNQGIYSNPLLRLPFTPWFEGNVDFHPRPAGHTVIADAFWAVLGMVPKVPTLDNLPDLFTTRINLQTPWVCGECAPGNRLQAPLPELAVAEPNTVEWLGAQIWNRSTRPLLCWSLALMQSGLNSYAAVLNDVAIPAVNDLYKLLYSQFFYLTSATSFMVLMGEQQRDLLWQLNGTAEAQLAQLQRLSGQQVGALDELSHAVATAWTSFAGGAVQPFSYVATLYLDSATSMISVLNTLETHKPPQLAALSDFWLFAALVGVVRGMWESQLGWWLGVQVALFYLYTVMVAVDSAGDL
jgi:lysophospholipase L1-like esterase